MNPDDGGIRVNVAHHQGDGAFDFAVDGRHSRAAGFRVNPHTFKAQDAEMTPAGREVSVRYLLNTLQGHTSIRAWEVA